MTTPAETPRMTRDWCPQCSPEVDPLRELVDEVYCSTHRPPTLGTDDLRLPAHLYEAVIVNGAQEAGGAANAALCQAIHRPGASAP